MNLEQEKIADALSLHGCGFAISETVQLVRDGYGRHFIVRENGDTEGPIYRGPVRTLQQVEKETYE